MKNFVTFSEADNSLRFCTFQKFPQEFGKFPEISLSFPEKAISQIVLECVGTLANSGDRYTF